MVTEVRSVGRAPRADSLPEDREYVDTGCELAPKCLECPFDVCVKHEGHRQLRLRPRDAELVAAARAGADVRALMERFKLSRRSVFRVLSEHRAEVPPKRPHRRKPEPVRDYDKPPEWMLRQVDAPAPEPERVEVPHSSVEILVDAVLANPEALRLIRERTAPATPVVATSTTSAAVWMRT